MSVLIKRIDTNSSGGSSKGYPPGNVTNVKIKNGPIDKDGKYKAMYLSWNDPDDIVVGNKTISTWERTIVVRSKGKVPSNYPSPDGILVVGDKYERNSWTEEDPWGDYIWINRDTYGTYYYRFFTINTDGVINQSPDMIYKVEVNEYDPILKNNSWDIISKASESGIASSLWNIGDEIDLTLSGTYNETVTLQIWDFNHFDKNDGSGKAGIVFGMKNLMKNTRQMNKLDIIRGGWNDTSMRNTVMQNILKSMPSNLQSYIKEVNTYAYDIDTSGTAGRLSVDKVFIPGATEVGCKDAHSESKQHRFPIFTDDNSRKKLKYWWTRSPYDSYDRDKFYGVSGDGTIRPDSAGTAHSVCFCFNV